MVVSVEGNRLSFKMNKTSFSELVSELQASVDDLVLLIKESENERDVLPDFAVLVEKFSPVLTDLRDSFSVDDSSAPIRKAVESLRKELCRAETLVRTPDLRGFVKQIEDLTHDLGRSLGLVLFSSLDAPKATKEKIGALHKELMSACFGTSQLTTASPSTDSRFSISSEIEIEEVEEEDVELDVIEEERASLEKDEVALQLKYGDDDKLKLALLELQDLVAGQTASCEWICDERIVPILVNRLSSCKTNSRLTVIRILRHLTSQNAEHKEKMADVSSLSVLVRSLSRDADERTETVKLLLSLSDLSAVRRRMGRIQGCIVMLVAMLNGEEDPVASHAAGKILNALSSNTQNALHMAEAGYFKPLVQYLKEGSDMSKILMATALSRMELTDQSKASLGKDGAIDPLVKMFNGGKLEAKSSSLNALHKLSTLAENIHRLVSSGIIIPLLQLLFSVTSVLMTLREPASAILARIAQSESVLVNPDVAQQMLSLLNFSSPAIQHHLLQALNSISCHPSASKIRRKMRGNGAIQLLLPFLTELDSKIRTSALDLLYTLSKDSPDELMEELGEFHTQTIVHIISSPSTSLSEKSAAVGLLSNLPITDKKATDILKRADLLPVLLSEMSSCHGGEEPSLVENIAGVLIRFTIPSDKKLQHLSVDHGVIPLLVKVLSCGSPLAKARAAISLAQLSQNSISLSKSRKPRWMCAAPSSDSFCEVHESRCIVRRTFCLVKAEAVVPLIQTLEGKEKEADDAVLDAIATLLQDEIWENGSSYLAKKVPGSVQAIVKVLESGSVRAQERALWILERIFRIDELRQEFGESAQGALVDLAQTGDDRLKPTVARLLAQLELLQVQSSYF